MLHLTSTVITLIIFFY